MTDNLIDLPVGMRWVKLVCRLGRLVTDSMADEDAYPDLLPVGGTLTLASSPSRVRIRETDGRWRSVEIAGRTYTIRSDGELVDNEGRVGVYIPDPSSLLIEPQGYAITAAVKPNSGPGWHVTVGGDIVLPDVVDLVAVSSVGSASPSVTASFDARIAAVEGILADGGTGTGSATRGLIVTAVDVPTIPAGDTLDNLAAYYNSGASAITVQGTGIAAGAHAVWAWVSGAWVLLASATGAPAEGLVTPTVTVTGQTETSITIAYSTTTSGVTGWQYRLDGGDPSALDGTSPDTITGLSPNQVGSIQVRFTVDGTTYSSWGTAGYATNAPAPKVLTLSWTDANPATPSGDAAAWTYTVGAGAPGSLNSIHAIPPGADGQFDVKMGSALAGGGLYLSPSYGFVAPASNTTTVGFATHAGAYRVGPLSLTTGTITTVIPAAGDILRLKKVDLSVEYWLSTDDGATFSQLGASSLTANDVPYFLSAFLAASTVISWAKGTGTTRWGVKAVTDTALDLAVSGAGITKTGNATTGYTYAMSAAGASYANWPTAMPRGAIETGISGLVGGTEGGAFGLARDTDGGGTVNASHSNDAYARVTADHTLIRKSRNVAEAAVAASEVTNASRFVHIANHPNTSSWQYTYDGFSPDGLHQWKKIGGDIVGGQETASSLYYGISCATGTMSIVDPRMIGTYA